MHCDHLGPSTLLAEEAHPDENVQDFVQFVSEGTEGTEAGGDGDGAVVVPEEHAEAAEGWNPSFVDYWEDEY